MNLKVKLRLFLLMQYILPQHGLSRMIGTLADSEWPWLKNFLIRLFIQRFKIDLTDAKIKDPLAYKSFNAFFIRELEDPFPVSDNPRALCSPAEALLSEFGDIHLGMLIQAKNHNYTLDKLLAQQRTLARTFEGGSFATLYLAPFNYHRVHMPIDGMLEELVYVPGDLFSVNLATTHHVPELFAKNERLIMIFNTAMGKLAVIMVGAMLVAGIENRFVPFTHSEKKSLQRRDVADAKIKVLQGAELGYFDFGSTVILLTEQPFQVNVPGGPRVKLGDSLGVFKR
jgi:phosphatidylserine decarboxylase